MSVHLLSTQQFGVVDLMSTSFIRPSAPSTRTFVTDAAGIDLNRSGSQ